MISLPQNSGRGPVPWGLVGMLGLMILVESFVARHAVDFTPWGSFAWRLSSEAATREGRSRKVLCFGDSLVKLGVIPRVLEERLGMPAYNLATCAAQAPTSYFLLRRALASGARPKAVIVDFKPNLLAGGPRELARCWQELLTWRECAELSWEARDPTFFLATALGLLLPSVRARSEIRINILLALQGHEGNLRVDTLRYARNWRANQGAQVTAKNPAFTGIISPDTHQRCLSDAWWCHRVNALYARRFLALAAARGIPVFWLLPPIAPAMQARREHSGSDAKHIQFVQEMQKCFYNIIIIDGRHSGYRSSVFCDPVHLDREGATALSAGLAAILDDFFTNRRQGPRWAALPDYRAHATRVALVDLDPSATLHATTGPSQQR
jgi:hypothetical protein